MGWVGNLKSGDGSTSRQTIQHRYFLGIAFVC